MIATRSQTSSISLSRCEFEQHADSPLTQLFQQAAHDPPPDRIQGAGRLVEQQQLRFSDQRLRNAEPLLHPLRHCFDPRIGCVAQRHQLEQLSPLRGAPRGAAETLVQPQELIGRAPAREPEQLRQVAKGIAGIWRPGRPTENLDDAGARSNQPAGDLHQG